MIIVQRDLKERLNWLAIALTLSLLVSCSSEPEGAIVGKWSEIEGAEIMEFFDDGTVTVVGKGVPMDGVYKFVEKDRIELKVGSLGAKRRTIVLAASISGDELTLTKPDGDVSRKYRRVK